jgi:2-haloacid dehalogenase
MQRVIVFDVYGTLLDIASPVARHAERIGPEAARLNDLWRAKQLEYSWVATLTGHYETFWTLTGRALDHALAAVGISGDPRLRQDLLDAYRAPAVYPEVPETLRQLREGGHHLAVFSNGDPAMLDSALSAGGIVEHFHQVLSVDPARRFKPDQAVYAHADALLPARAGAVVFLSSNGWDVTGAGTFGWSPVWVNRRKLAFEFPTAPSLTIAALDDLPAALAQIS